MSEKTTSLEDLRKLIDRSRVKCEICGFKNHSIAGHLVEEHGIDAAEYKAKYGKRAKLASKVVAEMLRTLPRSAQRTADVGAFVEEFNFVDVDVASDEFAEQLAAMRKVLPDTSDELADLVPEANEHFVLTAGMVAPTCYALQRDIHVYSEGPTGCGKTDGFLQLFARLGEPVLRVNMHGDVTVKNFLGQMVAENRSTRFQYGFLPRAMRGDGKRGVRLVVDELDYTPPQIGAIMNPVLENGGTLYIPETGETIRALPGFSIVATANTGGRGDRHGHYAGTELLNLAFLNRFGIKVVEDYLGDELERAMLANRFPEAEGKEIAQMVRAANEVRAAFKEGEIGLTLSTRQLIAFFEARRAMDFGTALDVTFLNWTDADDGALVREVLARVGLSVKLD